MLGLELPLLYFLFLAFALLSYRTNKLESNYYYYHHHHFLDFKYRTNDYRRQKSHRLLWNPLSRSFMYTNVGVCFIRHYYRVRQYSMHIS